MESYYSSTTTWHLLDVELPPTGSGAFPGAQHTTLSRSATCLLNRRSYLRLPFQDSIFRTDLIVFSPSPHPHPPTSARALVHQPNSENFSTSVPQPQLSVLSAHPSPPPMKDGSSENSPRPCSLLQSSSRRVSGKGWKSAKSPTVWASSIACIDSQVSHATVSPCVQNRRSHLPKGVKTKNWDDRMEKVKKDQAIKKLQTELKDEKLAEIQRCASFAH